MLSLLSRLHTPRLAALAVAGVSLTASAQAFSAAAPSTKKSAVIVGVSHSPGLGFAVAKKFAEGGLKVGLIGRQPERLADCRRQILEAVPGAEVECVAADATDPQAVDKAFGTLRAAHGAPDALVYNLSCRPFPPTKLADLDPARLESDWRTGAYGALLCTQAVLPAMKEAGRGCILFSGASASLRGSAKFGSFGASKGSLRNMAQALAKETAPDGIHVAHVVVDGMVDMPVINSFFPDAPKGRLLDTEACAEVYWQLYLQDKRCFTFEVDIRPHEAQW